jgi:predicted transcriptional regulator
MVKSIREMLNRGVSCRELAKCILGLKDLDIEIYKILLNSREMRVEELAEKIGRDPSTTYRALQDLIRCGIVFRESRSIPGGGYYYVYKAIEKKEFVRIIEECIKEWEEKMREKIKRMEKELFEGHGE